MNRSRWSGANGSGKSTLLKLIAGIHHATGGTLLVRAGLRIATMIELGVGFHPDLSGRENVFLNAAIHGLSREEIDALYPKVVEYAELDQFIDNPIKTYSSGMIMRLGFAVGINLNPDMFLLDEVFAVGDEAFQRKCLGVDARVSGPRQDDVLRVAFGGGRARDVRARDRHRPRAREIRRRH